MGAAASAARNAAEAETDNAEQKVAQMMQVLQNKLESIELQIQNTRGVGGENSKTEVGGGRTIMHTSEIRVSTNAGVSDQIKVALTSFFDAAQGAISGAKHSAKSAAVNGAQNLLSAGIDALMGVQSGQGMEKKSFVILFMNNAFVRVDYFLYTYSISGKKWGAEANRSGCCYVADMSVLDMAHLNPSEIDFLVSQALAVDDGDFDKLMEIKVRLIEVAILSNALKKTELSFKDLQAITIQIGETQKTIAEVFGKFKPFDKAAIESTETASGGLPAINGKISNTSNITRTPSKKSVV